MPNIGKSSQSAWQDSSRIEMRVLHIAEKVEGASGVATFVRSLDAALRRKGVESGILLRGGALPGSFAGVCDIVHIHGLWLRFFHEAARRAFASGVPLVWSTHGMTAPWSLRHKGWKKLPAWWLYQRGDLLRAAAVHCTTRQEAAWNARLGLKRCFVAPLGTAEIDRAPSLASASPLSPASPSPRADRILLFVGRLYPVKALPNLLKAWRIAMDALAARAAGRLPPSTPREMWRLRLVGPDEAGHRAELERLVRRLRLEDSVEFAGPLFGDALSAEYERCDCLVLPSHTENFGATVADALAHSKPCIASTNTPWEELPERGCGWWTSNDPPALAAAILDMVSAGDVRRREMGARGQALVREKYSWPAVADKMAAEYASLLDARQRLTAPLAEQYANLN